MITYEPLTKITTDKNGNPMISCRLLGTKDCQDIHMPKGCINCPVFKAILKQLHEFEEIYLAEDEKNERRTE